MTAALSSQESSPNRDDAEIRTRRRELVNLGRDHVARADWAAALATFIQANRSVSDPATERRILDLRRRAASVATPHPPAPVWPPDVIDPRPDLVGLPEIELGALDAPTLGGSILHHGALLVRGLAPEAQVLRLREAIDRAIDASSRPAAQRTDESYVPLDWDLDPRGMAFARTLTQDTGGLLAVDAPHAFFLLTELLTESGIVDVVAGYLDEPPILSVKKTTFRRIRDVVDPAWHQDGSFLGSDVRAVNLWLSLSHCGGDTDTVGLDLVAQRVDHILETGTDGAPAEEVTIGEGAVERASSVPIITPEFWPGDALLFDERFLHRTSAKVADPGTRYAVESWLFAPSHFPSEYGGLAI